MIMKLLIYEVFDLSIAALLTRFIIKSATMGKDMYKADIRYGAVIGG